LRLASTTNFSTAKASRKTASSVMALIVIVYEEEELATGRGGTKDIDREERKEKKKGALRYIG